MNSREGGLRGGARQPRHVWVVPNNSDRLRFKRCLCLWSSQRLGLAEMRVTPSPQRRHGEPPSYQEHVPHWRTHLSRKNPACTRPVQQMQLSLFLSITCIAASFSATRNVWWLKILLWKERVTIMFVLGWVASCLFSLSFYFITWNSIQWMCVAGAVATVVAIWIIKMYPNAIRSFS